MSEQQEETQLATMAPAPLAPIQELTVNDVIAQVAKIQQVMASVMKEGEHYGKIPGCGDKPTLLQPGAQKLMLTFRLLPKRQVDIIELGNGHREVRVITQLFSPDGTYRGEGAGCCTTLEARYRYRVGPKEFTGQPIPKEYWNTRKTDPAKAQAMLGGPGYVVGKNEAGAWEICIQGEKVEHDNPADYWNTVEKMACKRADVHASISTLAASDIFTQDLEDLHENGVVGDKKPVESHEAGQQQSVKQPQRTSEKSKQAPPTQAPPATGDTALQQELAAVCLSIANAGRCVTADDKFKTYTLEEAWPDAVPTELANGICMVMSTFISPKDGKKVEGRKPFELTGKWLRSTLARAKEVAGQIPQG